MLAIKFLIALSIISEFAYSAVEASSCESGIVCTITGELEYVDQEIQVSSDFKTLESVFASSSNKVDQEKTDRTGWFKLYLENNSSNTIERAISISEGGFRYIRFLKSPEQRGANTSQSEYGTAVESHQREFQTSRPTSRIVLEPHSSTNIYIYVDKVSNGFFNLYISTLPVALEESQMDSVAIFAYLGIVASMMIYQLFMFITLKEISHLLYVMFAFSMGVTVLLGSGQYALFFDGSDNQSMYFFLSRPLGTAVGIILPFIVFETWKEYPKLFKIGSFAVCALVAVTMLNLVTKFTPMMVIGDIANLLAIPIIIGLCLLYCSKGSPAAWVFLLGWVFLLAGVITWVLKNHGIVDTNNFTKRAVLIGGAIEMIMVGLAVSMKVKENEIKRIKAEDELKDFKNVSRLLRVVCHDIMNPMTIILMAAESLRHKNQEMAWNKVQRSSRMVVSIIEHVRKLESRRSAKDPIKLESVDISKVFQEIDFVFQERLNEKGVSLNIQQGEAERICALAEENSLMHDVLANFVSNAIKFSLKGDVITLKSRVDEKYIVIDVIDQGSGIPDKILNNIFDPSVATSTKGTNNEKGTGFGMPIAKSFVDDFGGHLKLFSRSKQDFPQEHGTTIAITLNRALA